MHDRQDGMQFGVLLLKRSMLMKTKKEPSKGSTDMPVKIGSREMSP